jgi:hypothetical protein
VCCLHTLPWGLALASVLVNTCFLGIEDTSSARVSCVLRSSHEASQLTAAAVPSVIRGKKLSQTTSTQETPSTGSTSHLQIPQQLWLREHSRPKISEDDLLNGAVLASNTARKVLKIGANMVVKFGAEVILAEAESLMYIRKNTTIPVPKILDEYNKDGCNYIVIEYMEGVLLKKVWDYMSSAEKSIIVSESKGFICQMRRLLPPRAVLIGSVDGGPAIDIRQFGSATGGPFRSEHDFNEWQLAQLRAEFQHADETFM